MSNYDHIVEAGLAEALRGGNAYARHAGRNFNGLVWFEGGQFHEQVWQYKTPRRTYSADTLETLMFDVNNDWGWS